jgi:sulfide dehydrogenase cytochrome subunit
MKKYSSYTIVLSSALAVLFAPVVHAEMVRLDRGAMLSNSCAACHGTGGNSPGAIPSIGGKSPEFIETALLEFKAGKRAGTVMNRHASGYTDEEIRLIAEFFAARK